MVSWSRGLLAAVACGGNAVVILSVWWRGQHVWVSGHVIVVIVSLQTYATFKLKFRSRTQTTHTLSSLCPGLAAFAFLRYHAVCECVIWAAANQIQTTHVSVIIVLVIHAHVILGLGSQVVPGVLIIDVPIVWQIPVGVLLVERGGHRKVNVDAVGGHGLTTGGLQSTARTARVSHIQL